MRCAAGRFRFGLAARESAAGGMLFGCGACAGGGAADSGSRFGGNYASGVGEGVHDRGWIIHSYGATVCLSRLPMDQDRGDVCSRQLADEVSGGFAGRYGEDGVAALFGVFHRGLRCSGSCFSRIWTHLKHDGAVLKVGHPFFGRLRGGQKRVLRLRLAR